MKTRSSPASRFHEFRSLDEGKEFHPRILAEYSAAALHKNVRAIQDQVPGVSLIPMIKANAYGHGGAWAARELAGLDGLYGLGVATLEEGREIRNALATHQKKTPIIVFSGTAPWSEEKGRFCEKFDLIPVIASEDDWHLFLRQGWPERLKYELKFNTGMNRLGITHSFASRIAAALRGKPARLHPQGILTHLASADDPDCKLSRTQRDRFREVAADLSGVFPAAHFHLGNSSAIWNAKKWALGDVVRPGLSLYGVPPWPGAPARGLEPVLTLSAQVIQVRELSPGERVGYGGTFRVEGPREGKGARAEARVRVATLSAGYADGLPRIWGNERGRVFFDDHYEPFIGRISMDLSAIRASKALRVGQYVRILGPGIDSWAQAQAAETIPYELLTSVSARVQRRYG